MGWETGRCFYRNASTAVKSALHFLQSTFSHQRMVFCGLGNGAVLLSQCEHCCEKCFAENAKHFFTPKNGFFVGWETGRCFYRNASTDAKKSSRQQMGRFLCAETTRHHCCQNNESLEEEKEKEKTGNEKVTIESPEHSLEMGQRERERERDEERKKNNNKR